MNLSYGKAEKPENTVFVRLWGILYLSYFIVFYRNLSYFDEKMVY